MPKKLTLKQIDSLNKISDSLYYSSLQKQKETKIIKKRLDSLSSLQISSKHQYKYNLSDQAQNYVVPAFITIITAVLIFGLITLADSQNADKSKHKESLLDSLDD